MKSNLVIKVVAVFIVVVLVVVIVKGRKGSGSGVNPAGAVTAMSDLSAVESGPAKPDNGLTLDPLAKKILENEYGVDVDSPVETMRTLTNETRAVREDSLRLQEENKRLEQEVTKLLDMKDNISKRINNQFSETERDAQEKLREIGHTQEETKGLISQLQRRLDQLQDGNGGKKKRQQTVNGYDIGNSGIPSGLGYDETGVAVDFDQIVWTTPIDVTIDPTDPTKISMPDFDAVNTAIDDRLPGLAKGPTKSDKKPSKEERLIRAYTIPANGTLMGSVSMTALLGRIPIGGQVTDPYPFKVMVGEENLSSNGIHIPGVIGIKMSGIAKGDWTLSCVSGDITSMTFTFQDGTIVTIPEPGSQGNKPIAWFSDRYGIPCISGQRITNAVSYLSSRVGLTTASAYASASADAETTTTQNTDGSTSKAVTGDPMTHAKNTAISGGLGEVTDWLDERQENSFDAIYVAPGTEMVIHVLDELKIDYDPEGRRVNHYAKNTHRTDRHLD